MFVVNERGPSHTSGIQILEMYVFIGDVVRI